MSVSLTGSAIYYFNGSRTSELPLNTYLTNYGFSGSQYKKSNNIGVLHYNNSSSNKRYLAGYRSNDSSKCFMTKLTFTNDEAEKIITEFDFNISSSSESAKFTDTKLAILISTNNYSSINDFYNSSNNIDSSKFNDNYKKTSTISVSTNYTFTFSNIEINASTFYVYLLSNTRGAPTTWTLFFSSPTIKNISYKEYEYTIRYYENRVNSNQYYDVNVSGYSSSFSYIIEPYPLFDPIVTSYANAIFNSTYDNSQQEKDIFKREQLTIIQWNTKKDGTGNGYSANAEIQLNGDLTLYAIYNSYIDYFIDMPYLSIQEQTKLYTILADVFKGASLKYTYSATIQFQDLHWSTQNYDYGPIKEDNSRWYLAENDVPQQNEDLIFQAMFIENNDLPPISLPSNLVREDAEFEYWSETRDGPRIENPDAYYPNSLNQKVYAVWSDSDTSKEGMYIYTNGKWKKVASIVTK